MGLGQSLFLWGGQAGNYADRVRRSLPVPAFFFLSCNDQRDDGNRSRGGGDTGDGEEDGFQRPHALQSIVVIPALGFRLIRIGT